MTRQMKILSHIIDRLNKPMCITPNYHKILCSVVQRHIENPMQKMAVDDLFDSEDEQDDSAPYDLMEGVRVIPVHGPIGYRVSSLEKLCGVADIRDISDNLDAALNDENVETIVLDINSPGGEITGLPELSAKIVAAGKVKNTVGFTDVMACSAAQWIMASCNETYSTPSAELGSIGVYCALYDVSEAYKQEGIKTELFTSGDLKAIGMDGVSLTDKQREHLQAEIDRLGDKFRSFMKSRIPNIQDEDMQGQGIAGEIMANKGYINGSVSSIYDIFSN